MEKIKVKILGFSCAHRKHRNTAWLTLYALKAAEKFGRRIGQAVDVETEFIDLAEKEKERVIRPCLNCDKRWEIINLGGRYTGTEAPKPRGCVIKNDYFARELAPKIRDADGMIFGSAVFNLSVTSKFRLLTERFASLIWQGYLTNKPVGCIAVATMPLGGQETCLNDMNNILRAQELVPVAWMHGAPGITGIPYGPVPKDDDGRVISIKKHRFAQWSAIQVARRVTEFAIFIKLAKRELGELYTTEFMQLYHPPHGGESWAWDRLDKEDEEFMQSLSPQEEWQGELSR